MSKKLIDTKVISELDRSKVSATKKYRDAASCIAQASKKSMKTASTWYVWPTNDSYQVSSKNSVHPNYGHVEVTYDVAKFFA
jgi:hypothetical protein